jgi:Anti-sigma-K factor rskA, C-terminal
MLSDSEIEAAHPDAFDFVFRNLPPQRRTEFNRHLSSCPHCQRVADEYSDVGRIIQILPPHVEPSADLEDRTVTAMVAAMAEARAAAVESTASPDRTATRIFQVPQTRRPPEPEARIRPIPKLEPPAEDEAGQDRPPPDEPSPAQAEPESRATVTRLPLWRRHQRRLAAVVAAAAAIIAAAIVVPLSLSGGGITTAQASVVIPLHVTAAGKASGYGSATGRATAHQDASGSWDVTLTVAHLKHFDPQPWYGCWYVSPDGRQVASAGTFLVPDSGSGTFTMTSAVDPHDFPTMEITIERPSKNGARAGTVILSGQRL